MKKIFLLTPALLLVIMGSGPIEQFNYRTESPYVIFGCTELVDAHVTWHFRGIIVEDGSGSMIVKYHEDSHAMGYGVDTGAKYAGTYSVNRSDIIRSFPHVITEVFTLHLSAQGTVENLAIKQLYHLTINANGEVTVEFGSMEVECK